MRQKPFQEFHTSPEAVRSPHAPSASASRHFIDKGSKPVPPTREYRCPRAGCVQCSEKQKREIKTQMGSFPSGPPPLPNPHQRQPGPHCSAGISSHLRARGWTSQLPSLSLRIKGGSGQSEIRASQEAPGGLGAWFPST